MVQPLAKPLMAAAVGKVNGGLRRPAVSGAGMEGSCIGVPHDDAVFNGGQIGGFLQGAADARSEFLRRRHIVFKGDSGVPHIVGVDFQQGRGVLRACNADIWIGHGNSS